MRLVCLCCGCNGHMAMDCGDACVEALSKEHEKAEKEILRLRDDRDKYKTLALKAREALEYSCEHSMLTCDGTCEDDKRSEALALFPPSEGKPEYICTWHDEGKHGPMCPDYKPTREAGRD
jgi:hypothetical protein